MADRFVVAVGKFIHHCGALELVVNNIIKSLAEDSLLIPFVLKSPGIMKIIELLQSRRIG
jgi:hypothetical protein